MTHVRTTVEVQASPEQVWSVLRDVELWPEWTATVTSVRRLDRGPLAVGSRAHIRQPKLFPAAWEVTVVDEGGSFTWVTRSPGVRVTGRHSVEAPQGGSPAVPSIQFSSPLGPSLARLLHVLKERYLTFAAKSLKAYSEASAASSRDSHTTAARELGQT